MRRLLSITPALALVACLAVLPACGKKAPPVNPGPVSGPGGDPITPGSSGAAVSSELAVFAQVNAKDVFAGELFAEILKSAGAGDAAKMKENLEKQGQDTLGVKPTDLASAAVYVTEIPERGEPKFVTILVANKPMDKAVLLKSIGGDSEPDARGFHKGNGPALGHFPDDKTAVMVHPDLADQYLAGFAKDRTGWPVSAEMAATAAGHTLYAQVQADKLPASARTAPPGFPLPVGPLLTAKSAALTLDLKGKTLTLGLRGSFPDAAAAEEAKKSLAGMVQLGGILVDGTANGPDAAKMGSMLPAVKEASRALKSAKVDVAGSDLNFSASYTADFDIGAIISDATKQVQGSAARMTAQNNFKQISLALLNYEAASGMLLVHGVGKGGVPLKKAADKPLLSWRVAILPYIEQDALYKQFKQDEAWDSDHNKKLIEKMPKIFAPAPGKAAKPGHTHIQMVVGPTALPTSGLRVASMTDGTSNTVAVAEAAEAVVWTKPDDIMLPGKGPAKDLKRKFGGQFPGGFIVAMWDGSVRFVKDTVSERTLGAALTPAGGEILGGDW